MKEIARLASLLLAILLLIGCRTTKKHVTESFESSELMEQESRDSSYVWKLVDAFRKWNVSIDNMELQYLPLPVYAGTTPSGNASHRPPVSPSSVPVRVRLSGINITGQEMKETRDGQEHILTSSFRATEKENTDISDIQEKKPSSRWWATGTILMLLAFIAILVFVTFNILTNHGRKDTL